jgi:hypothetical protein
MRKLVREVGGWVKGERFWDREAEIDSFIRLIDEGANILLTAPRRVGKTSLMREVAERLEHRYICLEIDLEGAQTAADAVVQLSLATRPHLALWDRTKNIFKNLLSGVESLSVDELSIKLRDGLGSDWQARADDLLVGLAAAEKPVLLLIDEFPILVSRLLKGRDYVVTPERIEKAEALLSWLRSNAAKHQGHLRFVVTGSVGIEPVLRQGGLSATLNTFTPFDLGAWDEETALGCLFALASQYEIQLAAETAREVTARLGLCIPHHVQLFFHHLYEDARRRGAGTIETNDVERVYNERMLSSRGHAELSHYEERLRLVLGGDLLPLALDLLTEAAVEGVLRQDAAMVLQKEYESERADVIADIREIVGVLEHDGYLKSRQDGYVFVSALLRDWWKARFGFGFIPAAQRSSG